MVARFCRQTRAGHQVIRNSSEPAELTIMHLDSCADYLRQAAPWNKSSAVRALFLHITHGPRKLMSIIRSFMEHIKNVD